MQQTERDLLIELKTKVESLIKSVDSVIHKMDDRDLITDKLTERVGIIENKVEENSKFRYWIIGSIITSLISLVINIIGKVKSL